MLYHVRMDAHPPRGTDPAAFDRVKAEEKARAQALQRDGTWVHLWRIAGWPASAGHDGARTTVPPAWYVSACALFPFMQISVTPLARHPLAIA